MGDAAVLGHAVNLNQVQAEVAVPLQHVGGHGCGTACRHPTLVQAKTFENLAAYQAPNQWNFQQFLQLPPNVCTTPLGLPVVPEV